MESKKTLDGKDEIEEAMMTFRSAASEIGMGSVLKELDATEEVGKDGQMPPKEPEVSPEEMGKMKVEGK